MRSATFATALASRGLRVATGFGANKQVVVQQWQYNQRAEVSTPATDGSAVPKNENSSGVSKPKKSRTGGDMSDEGQVHTPSLGKQRSTRDMFISQGMEAAEDKSTAEKKDK